MIIGVAFCERSSSFSSILKETDTIAANVIEASMMHQSLSETTWLHLDFNSTQTTTHNEFQNILVKAFDISDYIKSVEYKGFAFVSKYFIYFTSIPGLLTNPLSMYVSSKIRPFSTTEFHMFSLGITDLLVVLFRFFIHVLRVIKYNWNGDLCKVMFFVVNSSYTLSNWILVSWTIERLIAVTFPLKASSICTVNNVKKANLILVICCYGLNIPQLTEIMTVKQLNGSRYFCQYSIFYRKMYALFESFMCMYVPICIIVVCNSVIIYQTKQTLTHMLIYTSNKEIFYKRSRKQTKMTKLLIIVSTVFLFLHLTQVFAKIWEAIYPDPGVIYQHSAIEYLRFNLIVLLGYFITDFQNSINFFLYCLFGREVQTILRNAFYCCFGDT